MPRKDIVVIGASAGGIDALKTIASQLPRDFIGSVLVVVHTAADAPGVLANILDQAGPIPAKYAENGEKIRPGQIYVAPPDHHLVVEPGRLRLTRGPRENRFRPAIDPLFRSVAQVYGPRAVGVILTGGLDDGTSGLWAIERLGGTAIVQDPAEALAPSMPLSASRHVEIDHSVQVASLAPLLVLLAATPADAAGVRVPDELEVEVRIAKEDKGTEAGVIQLGGPSIYACPECHGVLFQMREKTPLRFRCHTGHSYTVNSLLAEMDEAIEESLWNAVRALEERVLLMRHASAHLDEHSARELERRARETERVADLVRQTVFDDKADDRGSGRG